MIEFKNKDGKYHRIDGPAVEYTNGDKKWYINGKLHREMDLLQNILMEINIGILME